MKSFFKTFFIPIVLFFAMFVLFPQTGNAESIMDNTKEINNIAENIDPNIEITEIDEFDEGTKLIQVDTEEELKELLEQMSLGSKGEQGTLEEQPWALQEQPIFSPLAYASFTRKSLLDSITTFRHVTYEYFTAQGRVVSVRNIKGTYTGVYVFSFKQNSASHTISADRKTINFTIRGYAFAGVSYKGVEFGAKYPQTWNYKHSPL